MTLPPQTSSASQTPGPTATEATMTPLSWRSNQPLPCLSRRPSFPSNHTRHYEPAPTTTTGPGRPSLPIIRTPTPRRPYQQRLPVNVLPGETDRGTSLRPTGRPQEASQETPHKIPSAIGNWHAGSAQRTSLPPGGSGSTRMQKVYAHLGEAMPQKNCRYATRPRAATTPM